MKNREETKMENEGIKRRTNVKAVIVKLVALILVVALLVVAMQIVVFSRRTTQQTEQAEVQALAEKEDFIKSIQKVTTDNEYMVIKTDANGVKVPVPRGYVGSDVPGENTVAGGYVIYEGETPVNSSNALQAQKERNQFVWVPVPDISKVYGMDANGKMWGKTYRFTTETGENIDSMTGTKPSSWSLDSNGLFINSGVKEPDILKTFDVPKNFKLYGLHKESTEEFLMDIEKEFETSLICIAKYGGFYIGRYETGGLSAQAVVRKFDKDIGNQTWYTMYEKCKKIRGANMNVVTGMIFGSQYDRTLMWIIESGNKTKKQVIEDSEDWANAINVELKYDEDGDGTAEKTKKANYGAIIPAGSCEKTKANNIYDLVGNVYDWTLQGSSAEKSRIIRGGSYYIKSTASTATSFLVGDLDKTNINGGCRAVLYIK